MVLLRRVIGDALRARRQGQHRTLREVSTAANVSLGYLSEIERGHKEPSSELLAAICDALGARLSELLREVSDTVALAEQMPGVLVGMQDEPAEAAPVGAAATVRKSTNRGVRQVTSDGKVAVSVRHESPLKATLRSTRVRPTERDRDVVCAA
ncbi:helix-turn-helix transcriptional regulator [Micromonospora sp. ALFpr18c]|uniref:helix-turn-helix domain-containing protein n=1 Tax=unclassified Micromonospora TaxID=2617518 RepID=UPI00124AEE99|nr:MULTISPECIES: helix-turn-helix transcriptional regulator [unclassified Micromonospora]KAB1931939.1 helix-turn-helix transcriptional regulator [Micromonospora sp. ALFpr18c]MDG4759463.1 helix-turn-helix transcriptional regulator [Micromonospora sp. WMMD710]